MGWVGLGWAAVRRGKQPAAVREEQATAKGVAFVCHPRSVPKDLAVGACIFPSTNQKPFCVRSGTNGSLFSNGVAFSKY